MTKIKGWRNKFSKLQETPSSNCDGKMCWFSCGFRVYLKWTKTRFRYLCSLFSPLKVPPKNLSAFCSNMLDEYLESEAQQISDRAAAFSTTPESSVTYQLPAKSSSYVKTLDSVLRHQNAASRVPEAPSRPCPLSRKPPPYTSLRSQASPLTGPEPQHPAEPQSTSSSTHLEGYISQRYEFGSG